MRSHRQLFAWQKADRSALEIHRFADQHWRPARSSVFGQLRRASLSVPLNIAEGNAYGPGRRYRFHLRVAYASAVETTALLEFLESLDGHTPTPTSLSREVQALTLRLLRARGS